MKSKGVLKDGNRLIRKYPNRRLYDTEISNYVPFSHLKELVIKGVEFYIEDVKTKEDVTRNVLINMIQEENFLNNVPFSEQFLRSIISFYGNANQGLISNFLEISIRNALNLQSKVINNNDSNSLEKIEELQKQFTTILFGNLKKKD